MNGPAFVLLATLLVAGAFMLAGFLWRRRRPALPPSTRPAFRLAVASLWVVAVACLLAYAAPGDQPRLSGLITAAMIASFLQGLRDFRRR